MKPLKDVLRQYLPEAALGAAKKTEIDRERLQADLRGVVSRNQLYFNLIIGMPVLLFVGLLVAVLTHLDRPEWVRALSIATGVSFLGVIQVAAKLWKSKVLAETVIALAGSLPEDALKAVLGTLIRKM